MRVIATCELVVQKGVRVPAGETVSLPDPIALRLIGRGLAREAQEPHAPVRAGGSQGPTGAGEGSQREPGESSDSEAPDDDAIMSAMLELDEDDASLWTRGGKPKTEAVEAVLGAAITAEQRDRIWAEIQAD